MRFAPVERLTRLLKRLSGLLKRLSGLLKQIRGLLHGRHGRQLGRYSVGSVVAAATSHLVFLVVYALGAGPKIASIVGFAAGIAPNYHISRRWAWGHDGRSRLLGEVLPYLGIALVSLVVTVFGTDLAEGWIRQQGLSRPVEVVAVTAAFGAVNGALFLGKYLVLDRWLFGRGAREVDDGQEPPGEDRSRHQVPTRTRA